MAEDVISSYIDKEGVEKDTKYFLDKLNELHSAFKRINELKIGIGGVSGLGQSVPIIKETQEELKKLSVVVTSLVQEQKKAETAQKTMDKAVVEGRVEKQKYNAELKREIELQNANNGSIEQAKALIKSLTAERNKLNLSTEEGRKKQALLNDEIDKANEFIRKNVDTLSKQKINIGNYEGSAKIIVDALERARQKVVQTTKDFGKLSPEASAARNEFAALERITGQPQFLNISSKVGDTNKELRFFTQRLNELEDAGLKNSKVYNDVRARLAQLTDQLSDTKSEIKALSSDSRSFDLFAGSVNFAADAFQTFAGAAQLAGASEEEVTGQIRTLVAIQSVANGVKGIANELTTKGTAANKAFAFVQKQISILTSESTTATQKWGAALKTIGIGLIITLVVKLVDSLNLFGDSSKRAAKETERLTKAIDAQRESFGSLNEDYEYNLKLSNERLKKLGANEEAIRKNTLEIRKRELEDLKLIEKSKTDERLKAEIDFNKRRQVVNKLQGRNRNNVVTFSDGLTLQDVEKNLALKAQLEIDAKKETEKKIREITVLEAENETAIAEKTREDKKKLTEKGNEQIDKLNEEVKIKAEANRAAEFELQKIGIQQAIDFNKEIVDDEKASLEERLVALRLYLNAKSELLSAERKFNLGKSGITDKEIDLENEKFKDGQLRLGLEVNKTRISLTEDLRGKLTTGEKELQDGLAKIAENGYQAWKELQEAKTDKNKEESDKRIAQENQEVEEIKRLRQQLASEIQNLVFTVLTSSIENEKNQLQDQIDLLEEKKQKDIEVANQTIANAQDRAAAISVIEARANAEREQLQKRQRELDIKKAQFDKAQAVTRIIQNTAVAVIRAIAEGQGTLVPLILALGAAQLATVVAQPIPRYKHGKNLSDTYEGPAIVGDGGKKEAIIREGGQVEITADRPQLTYVKSRDVILPDVNQLVNYVLAGGMGGSLKTSQSVPIENNMQEIKHGLKEVVSAINRQPKLQLSSNEAGMAAMWKYGMNQIKYINENTNW